MILLNHIVRRFTQVVRVNQPSPLQEFHEYHGRYFFVDGPLYKDHVNAIIDGSITRIPSSAVYALDVSLYDEIKK